MALLDDVARRLTDEASHQGKPSMQSVQIGSPDASPATATTGATTSCVTPAARSSKGDGYYNGRYDATSGFSYGQLRILHGDHYGASYTDALLHAAWVEGSLGSDSEPPTWWQPEARLGCDNPGLTLKRSSIEVRCNDAAFELVLRTDDKDLESRVGQALEAAGFPHAGLLVPVEQQPDGDWLVDCEDRIELCVRLVKALVAAEL